MATLKQIFKEQRKQHYHKYGDTIPYNPIEGVKQWIQQKLTNMTIPKGYHSGILQIKKEAIKELWDELE